jgi:hypothetical protein
VRSLSASLRWSFRQRARTLRRPQELGIVTALRRAWVVSNPDWLDDFRDRFQDPAFEARRAESERKRAEVRARRRAEGPAVYSGELRVRPIFRGMVLDLDGYVDVEDWLAQQLGLDAHNGETVHVRLTAELLSDGPA